MPSVLYVGDLGSGLTSQDRLEALADLGASVDAIGPPQYAGWFRKIDWILGSRLQVGPGISRLNRAIAEALAARRYDILWLDKGWMVQPRTVEAAKSGGSSIVLFNNDNPWGGHERGLWRLHKGIIPLVDEIIVPKYSVVRAYELMGARRVSIADFGFAPRRHFRPDTDVRKEHEICFIGTALKDGGNVRQNRTAIMLELGKLMPGRISVFGHGWRKALGGAVRDFKIVADGAWDDQYRETIWKSKVNLSFVTRDNWEESSHRAFEITACGGCLLAERSSRLEQSFVEGSEAAFFGNVSDCVATATRLLEDESWRDSISRAGNLRALNSGYDNQSRLREVICRSPVLRRHFPELSSGRESNAARPLELSRGKNGF